MHLFLFVIYGIVCCFLLQRIRFFRDSGIRPSVLLLLFALRVATGCLHNFVAWRFFPNHGDIWAFFQGAAITRYELFHDFHAFIADNSTWAYMPYNVIVCLHVLFNFFSFGDLYINTLFFSFGVFAGNIALFRAFRGFFGNDLLCAVCTLLIPSLLFWTACVYKEGFIFLSLGYFFYHLHGALSDGWNKKRAILCLLFFCLAAFFRASIAVSLAPALLFLLPRRTMRIALTITLISVALISILRPTLFQGVLSYFSDQQEKFQILAGHSRLYLPELEPTAASFRQLLPRALLNGFLEPLPGAGGQPIYTVFAVELLLAWSLVILAFASLLRPRPPLSAISPVRALPRRILPPHSQFSFPFACCCLAFSLSGMLLIGYIVPFAGAIVRYRSLYLPFLLAPFVHILRRQPFFQRLNDRLCHLILAKGH
jgi:hypothetical protein